MARSYVNAIWKVREDLSTFRAVQTVAGDGVHWTWQCPPAKSTGDGEERGAGAYAARAAVQIMDSVILQEYVEN